ncbi:RING finger protein 32-like [Patiria miniata]|uniref:RING-type domain-containing protein n=1 Tax=Patiria miniata TaxID=46514 RepID=A0A913Z2V5_PATMI|nr:RING finger protein 32-like [Patiria miniata]
MHKLASLMSWKFGLAANVTLRFLVVCFNRQIVMNFKKDEQLLMRANNMKTGDRQSGSSTALAAVAFQDHLMRNLSLADPLKTKRPIHHGRPKKQVKAVVDTGQRPGVGGRKGDAPSNRKTEKEYVLDQKPQPLTLAQKLGLMEAPEQPLSDLDWRDAKEKSNRRDDSILPCVICKEEFGLQQQVLLSCSHVFHRNCLQAFERFTGKKTCPMCRKEQYQTRVIHEGAKLHRVRCAIRIQACWRGYVVYSWYRKLRQTVPPKDPRLRKKFYEERLQAITERLLRSYDTNIDSFLAEMDRSITASRDVFKNLEASNLRTITPEEWDSIQLKAVERGKTECPICIMPLHQPDNTEPITNAPNIQHRGKDTHSDRPPNRPGNNSSAKKKNRVRQRDTGVTSAPSGTSHSLRKHTRIDNDDDTSADRDGDRHGDRHGHRHTVLLSCTHVFHLVCLQAFEELSLAQTKVCPVCRSGYQKKVLSSFYETTQT